MTGINSPGLGGPGSSSGGGVDSLQQLAKEVENKQLGVCVCVCVCARARMCVYIYECVCMYVYVCTHKCITEVLFV